MRTERSTLIALAAAGAMFHCATFAQAPKFAEPVRLMAGDPLLGEGRLYPSPVYQDMNGDGLLDIVVGDLRGLLTVALRLPGEGPPKFGAESNLKALDGKDIDFHNW
jgi:hypothetical protein